MARSTPQGEPSSELSSDSTFHTAKDDQSTAASSPVHSTANPTPLPCPYRETKELPVELRNHCQIFLEEQLYSCAIGLLSSVLAAGGSCLNSNDDEKNTNSGSPVVVPPASHLALLNTLTIHPLYTTRAEKPEYAEISALALAYLRNLLAVAGPIHAGFRVAFQYHAASRRNFRRSEHFQDSDMSDAGDGTDSDGEETRIRGRMANDGGLWNRGQNFWATVGWTFNCSTMLPKRWRYWRRWLEFMLEVLQADWTERERMDEAAGPQAHSVQHRSNSILAIYMAESNGGGRGQKGIMKALFADGGELSSSAFQEVFDKEPRGPSKKENKKRKRDTGLDLENDKFGDYFDDESISSGVSEPPTPQQPKDTTSSFHTGFVESVPLRLMLFRLISAATHALQKPSELEKLYENFAHEVKVSSLQNFSLIVSQRPNNLLEATHITLLRDLFKLLLPSTAKDPRKVDRESHEQGSMSADMLEQCYVAYPANTIGMEDNAKLSLVIESAVQLLWSCGVIDHAESLAAAIEIGIQARQTKATKRRNGKMKAEAGDRMAQEVLDRSGVRLRLLVQCLKMSAGDGEEE